MENQTATNKNTNEPIIELTTTETVVMATTPIIIEEGIELVEAQSTESAEEKALVVAKETVKKSPFAIKNLLQSLFYAIQWAQLKRQFTKDALWDNTKRHWMKGAALGTFFYCTQITFTTPNTHNSTAAVLPSVTRSAAPLITTTVVPTVSTEANALVPVATVSIEGKEQYIKRFVSVAQGEMTKYGIPASVSLAMSIMESNYGTTPLAQGGNNYFALTCAANPLAEGVVERAVYEGTCYMHYENAWTSFRANSLRLHTVDFNHLKANDDFYIWASALEAKDLVEAASLIGLINLHNLSQYDKIKK